jgi:hypothetical protein
MSSLGARVDSLERSLGALEESPLTDDARATVKIAADYIGQAEALTAAAALSDALTAAEIEGEERARLIARLDDGDD